MVLFRAMHVIHCFEKPFLSCLYITAIFPSLYFSCFQSVVEDGLCFSLCPACVTQSKYWTLLLDFTPFYVSSTVSLPFFASCQNVSEVRWKAAVKAPFTAVLGCAGVPLDLCWSFIIPFILSFRRTEIIQKFQDCFLLTPPKNLSWGQYKQESLVFNSFKCHMSVVVHNFWWFNEKIFLHLFWPYKYPIFFRLQQNANDFMNMLGVSWRQ